MSHKNAIKFHSILKNIFAFGIEIML